MLLARDEANPSCAEDAMSGTCPWGGEVIEDPASTAARLPDDVKVIDGNKILTCSCPPGGPRHRDRKYIRSFYSPSRGWLPWERDESRR